VRATCEKPLLDALCKRSPQEIHKVFTDKPSLECVRIWWRFGKDARSKDEAWLRRQIRASDFSVLGLMCMIAGFQGARKVAWAELELTFRRIDEELCVIAGIDPITRRRKGQTPESQSPAVVCENEATVCHTAPLLVRDQGELKHRHD